MNTLFILVLGTFSLALSPNIWAVEGQASVDYTSAFVHSDPIMSLGLKVQEKLAYELELSLEQSINRNLVVDASKKEWEWNNTVIALSRVDEKEDGRVLGTTLSFSLPTSIEARHEDLYTRPELKVYAAIPLPFDWRSVSGFSVARYFYKYDATELEGQTSGGEALPIYTYKVSQSFGWEISPQWSTGLGASYRVERYYDLKSTDSYIAASNRLEDYAYSLGVSASYHYSDRTSASVSFEQGSGLERPGYNDFVFYDKEQSTWTLSLLQLW